MTFELRNHQLVLTEKVRVSVQPIDTVEAQSRDIIRRFNGMIVSIQHLMPFA